MTIQGVLFDIDDTLIDYSATVRIGFLRHLAAEGVLDRFDSPDAAVAVWRAIEDEEYPRFVAGELSFTEQQRVRTERFFAHIDVTGEDPVAWFGRYAAHRDTAWAAFPDAAPILRSLDGRVRLGVISNASLPYQIRKLRAVGLLDHFVETIVCSDEFGAAKPDPSIFLAGCELLDLEPGRVAYVGDRYDWDALGARDAGLRSFWLVRDDAEATAADGITVIRSLAELDSALG
ncbi:HAD family hydrolase [Nocardia heshunensis]